MEIKLFMDVTDRNFNMFDLVSDSIRLYDINSGLAILQATDSFNKLNAKKLLNMTEILFHFGWNIKYKSFWLIGTGGDETILNKFKMKSDTKQSKEYSVYLSAIRVNTAW